MLHREVRVDGQNYRVTLRDNYDAAILYEILEDRQYNTLESIIRSAQHAIIDIGGHLGFFALYARSLNATVPLYIYEPYLANYELLKQHLKENNVNKYFVHQSAVADADGESILYLSEANQNHTLTTPPDPTGGTQPVHTTSLSRIMQKYALPMIDLVKMDCEGGEYAILSGVAEADWGRIQTWFVEYHDWVPGHQPQELVQLFKAHGYQTQVTASRYSRVLGHILAKRAPGKQ